MQAQIEISPDIITESLARSLFKGELGELVAERLAYLYAEITTYNRTDTAKLLNIGRSTVYDYESKGLLIFRSDGRITLASLIEFQRSINLKVLDDKTNSAHVNRKPHKIKRRALKK